MRAGTSRSLLVLLTTVFLVAACAGSGAATGPPLTPSTPMAAVPPATAPSSSTSAAAPVPTATPAATPASTPPPELLIVVVVPGDTLSEIAERYGVTLATILDANPQIDDPKLIHVGEQIVIPREAINVLPVGTHDGSTVAVASTRDQCVANGWASDPNDRTRDVAVRIVVDGTVRLALVANGYRPDVEEAGAGDATSGFSVELWDLVTPNVPHEIRAQAQDPQTGDWVDLNNTPRQLTCRVEEATASTPPGVPGGVDSQPLQGEPGRIYMQETPIGQICIATNPDSNTNYALTLTLARSSHLTVLFTGEFGGLEADEEGLLVFNLDGTNPSPAWSFTAPPYATREAATISWTFFDVPEGTHYVDVGAQVSGGNHSGQVDRCSLTVTVVDPQ